MRKFLGGLLIVFALVLAIVPLFTDCLAHGRELKTADGRAIPMKCHWAAIAEIGAAVPMGLMGVLALRKKQLPFETGLMGLSGSALAILFPTVLIGVCATATMPCAMIMRPIILLTATLAALTSVAIFVTGRKPAAVEMAAA